MKSHRIVALVVVFFLWVGSVWAGVPVRPGIPIYCITKSGKLYVDKKDILDEWLSEQGYKIVNTDKKSGEAYTVKNKAGSVIGYVIIDKNISMKHAWDVPEIDEVSSSKDLSGYRGLLNKYGFDMGKSYPGFKIANLKAYGPR